jgi:hypothetical protein
MGMSVNFPHPSGTGPDTAVAAATHPRQASPQRRSAPFVDLSAVRRAGRSCCCSAKPLVIALIPAPPGRPHQTDLLLCGHHYRASRPALAAAGATVMDIDGMPVSDDLWSLAHA